MKMFLSSGIAASALLALSTLNVQAQIPGGLPPSGRLIVYGDQSKNWADAETYCATTHSTHLATLFDANDQAYLMAASPGVAIWVGLNDKTVGGSYVWVSGATSTINPLPWADGEPTSGANMNCVIFNGPNIYTADCDDAKPFACDVSYPTAAPVTSSPTTRTPTTGTPTKTPTTGAPTTGTPTKSPTTGTPSTSPTTRTPTTGTPTRSPTKVPTLPPDQLVTLTIVTDQGEMDWNNATEYCIKHYKTSLATVRTVKDQEALDATGLTLWIGLNDIEVEADTNKTKYVWASGEPYNPAISYWTNGKDPNGGTAENCVANFGQNKYHWADDRCFLHHHFACDTKGEMTTTRSKDPSVSLNSNIGIVTAIIMIICMLW